MTPIAFPHLSVFRSSQVLYPDARQVFFRMEKEALNEIVLESGTIVPVIPLDVDAPCVEIWAGGEPFRIRVEEARIFARWILAACADA